MKTGKLYILGEHSHIMNNLYNNVNMITCDFNSCYVIRGEKGDILIDTSKEKYRDEIETWLHDYNVKLIVLTHGHNDHIGNAKYFADLYDAKIVMSQKDIKLSRDNNIRKIYRLGFIGNFIYTISNRTFQKMSDTFNVDYYVEDGMKIGEELGINAYAVALGGHTKGSFGIMHNNDLYCGDALMNFVSPSMPYLCESPKNAKESLAKIKTLKPNRIFFGHGIPISTDDNTIYKNMF